MASESSMIVLNRRCQLTSFLHTYSLIIIRFRLFNTFRFKQPAYIYGLEGVKEGLQVIRHPYAIPFGDLAFRLRSTTWRKAAIPPCLLMSSASFWSTQTARS